MEVGERNITRQREIVARLEQGGHDATQADAILSVFEQTQALHLADRDKLLRELAALTPPQS